MREEIRMKNIGIVTSLWYICTLVNTLIPQYFFL